MKNQLSTHRLMPVVEVARLLGISDVTVRRLVQAKRIPALRVGSKIVIRGDVVERIQREGIPARTPRSSARKA